MRALGKHKMTTESSFDARDTGKLVWEKEGYKRRVKNSNVGEWLNEESERQHTARGTVWRATDTASGHRSTNGNHTPPDSSTQMMTEEHGD
jgi:hypothetical protein